MNTSNSKLNNDWNIDQQKAISEGLSPAHEYDVNWYFPRTMGGDDKEAKLFIYPHEITVDKAQAHIKRLFGESATMIAIKGSTPDMLNGWRCEDVRFEWVDKNKPLELENES